MAGLLTSLFGLYHKRPQTTSHFAGCQHSPYRSAQRPYVCLIHIIGSCVFYLYDDHSSLMPRTSSSKVSSQEWRPPPGYIALKHPELALDYRRIPGIEIRGPDNESTSARDARLIRNANLYEDARVLHNVQVRKLKSRQHTQAQSQQRSEELSSLADSQQMIGLPSTQNSESSTMQSDVVNRGDSSVLHDQVCLFLSTSLTTIKLLH
jgi:hypothetical protein